MEKKKVLCNACRRDKHIAHRMKIRRDGRLVECRCKEKTCNPTWRPRAKSKAEKEHHALRNAGFSRPRDHERGCVEPFCKKLALVGSPRCPRHHDNFGHAAIAVTTDDLRYTYGDGR